MGLFPWLGEAGVSWRLPRRPELELRAGYHAEGLGDSEGGTYLFAHGAFVGLAWAF